MKEDSQLICPISYDDPSSLWTLAENDINTMIILQDITLRIITSSTNITIKSLPLRYMPSNANLFKDSDHPFRWFLAPYVYVYILGAENMDSYRGQRSSIKTWVDSHSGIKRSSWLILYIPLGSQTMDTYNKVSIIILSLL
jgi:hypothetical protein